MSADGEQDRIEAELARDRSRDPFGAAVRATPMPMLITDPSQADNPVVFVNDAFCRLTGYAREEIVGRNCRFLQGPETDWSSVAKIRRAIERRAPIDIELRNHKKNGEAFWNRLLMAPVFNQDDQLTHFIASQIDVTRQRERLVDLQADREGLERQARQRSRDLAESEERLRFLMKAGRFGAWTLDLADMRLVASELCKENFGRFPTDPFTYGDLTGSIVEEDRPRMREAVTRSIERHEDYDIEYRILTPRGERRWILVRGQTIYRADGQALSMAGVSIDVTERKNADEHRELLAAELNHRVKNSMATILSIAHQTLRHAASLEDAQTVLDARIQSLSAAHDVLMRENWEGATFAEIVEGALRPFRTSASPRFAIDGPAVRLPPRWALALILALHELATNAIKYGALSNEAGQVLLTWDVGEGPRRLRLRWEERDGPPVVPPARKGFGSRLIERALASEMGGSAEIAYRPAGVVFTLEAPLP